MKKCLVLDLDNTLWGGVVGEDGIENLALSLSHPGNGFMAFQQAILDHHDKGVILAINSRNNPEDAWAVIRTHPNMILKEHHFAAHRMNWMDKAQNIRDLAAELNIGTDSMVFLDDDPTNRDLVRSMIPEVMTPDLPQDPAEYARFLNSLGVFDLQTITDEDKMRGNLYVTERLRREQEKEFQSKDEFLNSLQLELTVYEDDVSCLARLAQLTEKTNQFNVNKQPMTEDEIAGHVRGGDKVVFYAKLQDRFGDYGIIAMAIAERQTAVVPDDESAHWHLSTMLMSCRVFGRAVEDAFLACVCQRAVEEGAKTISIEYTETPKNIPAREFIDRVFGERKTAKTDEVGVPEWISIHRIAN